MRAASISGSRRVTFHGGEWRLTAGHGVTMKVLCTNEESGEGSALLRFDAGGRFPAHNHPAGEQLFVLDGEVRVGRRLLSAGDYLYTPHGAVHAASSVTGCLLFVTAARPIELVLRRGARRT